MKKISLLLSVVLLPAGVSSAEPNACAKLKKDSVTFVELKRVELEGHSIALCQRLDGQTADSFAVHGSIIALDSASGAELIQGLEPWDLGPSRFEVTPKSIKLFNSLLDQDGGRLLITGTSADFVMWTISCTKKSCEVRQTCAYQSKPGAFANALRDAKQHIGSKKKDLLYPLLVRTLSGDVGAKAYLENEYLKASKGTESEEIQEMVGSLIDQAKKAGCVKL